MTSILDRQKDPKAAPVFGTEQHDVAAVNRKADREFYASRQQIYPRLAHGTFRRLKWIVMAVTLGIYYALPWLRWNRGPDLPVARPRPARREGVGELHQGRDR